MRRAKLYYLRDRVGKRARVRQRRSGGPRNVSSANWLYSAESLEAPSAAVAAGDGSVAAAPVSVPEPSGSVAGEPSGVAAGAA